MTSWNADEEAKAYEESGRAKAAATTAAVLEDARATKVAQAVAGGARAFISPQYNKMHILLNPGPVRYIPDVSVPDGRRPAAPEFEEVYIDFVGGVAIIQANDPARELKIAWCEANSDKCRDVLDKQAEAWAAMKESQLSLANREPSLDPSLDVDAVLRGDVTGFGPTKSLASRARAMLEQYSG